MITRHIKVLDGKVNQQSYIPGYTFIKLTPIVVTEPVNLLQL